MKDPFEVQFEEQGESPPESPFGVDENESQVSTGHNVNVGGDFDAKSHANTTPISAVPISVVASGTIGKPKEDDEEEEEENMEVELAKFPTTGDPTKMARMQAILALFTEEQMSRYESFRRSGFQKSDMKRLLISITGNSKISPPMTIVVSGIAKLLVGEIVETAKMVMAERVESGPIRPCHIREAHRRLKLDGKIPKRSVPRLYR